MGVPVARGLILKGAQLLLVVDLVVVVVGVLEPEGGLVVEVVLEVVEVVTLEVDVVDVVGAARH